MEKQSIPGIYGLIGYPIKHSLSPAMHTAAFKKLRLNAVYMLFERRREDFAHTIKQMRLMNVLGFNVTVPYKEEIIPYLDELDPQASRIAAVNTVVNSRGKLIGYNTDSPGFIASLKSELKFDPRGKGIFIIGSGGAARAIGFALAKEKAKTIVFYDVLKRRAEKLSGDIGKIFPQCAVSFVNAITGCQLSNVNLLVNASTCGMKDSDPQPIDHRLLPEGIKVYDIIYNPSTTKLIRAIRKKGLDGVNGLGMLLGQGALAFEIWTRQKAPVAAMRGALLKAINGKPE